MDNRGRLTSRQQQSRSDRAQRAAARGGAVPARSPARSSGRVPRNGAAGAQDAPAGGASAPGAADPPAPVPPVDATGAPVDPVGAPAGPADVPPAEADFLDGAPATNAVEFINFLVLVAVTALRYVLVGSLSAAGQFVVFKAGTVVMAIARCICLALVLGVKIVAHVAVAIADILLSRVAGLTVFLLVDAAITLALKAYVSDREFRTYAEFAVMVLAVAYMTYTRVSGGSTAGAGIAELALCAVGIATHVTLIYWTTLSVYTNLKKNTDNHIAVCCVLGTICAAAYQNAEIFGTAASMLFFVGLHPVALGLDRQNLLSCACPWLCPWANATAFGASNATSA